MSTFDLATRYIRAGLSVFPVRADGSKAPALPWSEYRTRTASEDEVRRWWPRDGKNGIGVVCGAISCGLAVLDFEEESAYSRWEVAARAAGLGAIIDGAPLAATGGGGRHLYLRVADGVTHTIAARDAAGQVLVEVRREGHYVVAPGSPPATHTSGEAYRWIHEGWALHHVHGGDTGISLDDFTQMWDAARALDASPVKPARAAPPTAPRTVSGTRPGDDYNARAQWSDVLGPHGWRVAQVGADGVTYWTRPGKDAGVSATTGRCESEAGTELLHVFTSNAAPFDADGNYSKYAAYTLLNHNRDFGAATRALAAKGYGEQKKGAPAIDWGTGEPVAPVAERFQPFPVSALPEPFRGFVSGGARAIGCDPSFVAIPLVVAAASAIGTARSLVLKRGWEAPSIIWAAVVGESGTAKTPAFKLAMGAVRAREAKAMAQNTEAMKGYQAELARWDKENTDWKRDKRTTDAPPAMPTPPRALRHLVQDTTIEALAPILSDNPRGLLVARDELGGWLGGMDRYAAKSGGDAPIWLSMFNAMPITVDRKTGTPRTLYVPQAAVSVVGGIQPAILRRHMAGEHQDSGLFARLLLASPPRQVKTWTEDDIDPALAAEVGGLFDRLYELQPDTNDNGEPRPLLVTLAADAKALWIEYYQSHASEQAELSGALSAAWSKLEEYAARLALVTHFVRWAARDPSLASESVVDAASMRAGIALAQWFKGEARRVYHMLAESDTSRESRELVEWIERKGGSVTIRDVQQGCRRLKEPGAAEAALNELVKGGRGEWRGTAPTGGGGRPKRAFALSTCLHVYETPKTLDVFGVS